MEIPTRRKIIPRQNGCRRGKDSHTGAIKRNIRGITGTKYLGPHDHPPCQILQLPKKNR
jgi:hypothetical protein